MPCTKKHPIPSTAEKARALAQLKHQLKGNRYERFFTPASLELAAGMFYPIDAVRLETKFCKMCLADDPEGGGNLDFGDLYNYAPAKTDRDLALILMVAQNLCLLHS